MDNTDEVRFAKGFLEAKGYTVVPVKEYERDAAAFIALDDESKGRANRIRELETKLAELTNEVKVLRDAPRVMPPANGEVMHGGKVVRNWTKILRIPDIIEWCSQHPGEFKTVRVPSQDDAEIYLGRSAVRRAFNKAHGRGYYEITAPDGNSFRISMRRLSKPTKGPRPVQHLSLAA